jgi:transposase-like protein
VDSSTSLPSQEEQSPEPKYRIPLRFNGIQYNFCKNPKCSSYGVEPTQESKRGTIGQYSIQAAGKGFPLLKCNTCGETPPMKSNQGIAEELDRLSAYLALSQANTSLCCPNEACSNHSVPLNTKKAYRSFGTAASGAKRYQCTVCKKTFSIAKPTKGQHDTHHNIEIFKLLVNKVPLNRIINILDISWEVLYHRINFIHQQCLSFVADRESKLNDMPIKRLYLAIDRQDYEVNWTERKDKRNIILSAIASADNLTGYVFGMHPNFDNTLDKDAVEQDANNCADHVKPDPFKKYARLWLNSDYEKTHKKTKPKKLTTTELKQSIVDQYQESQQREDVEVFDTKTREEKLPDYGIQIRAEYTMIAHFYFLKNLLGNVEKWRFFLDQESGIRSACLTAFQPEIAEHKAEAFYVRIEKDLTVDEKRKFKAEAKKRFDFIQKAYPFYTENEVKLEILKSEIKMVQVFGQWKDKWVNHPHPSMSESNKAMCWLTEHEAFTPDHTAWLYNKASLHAVDTYFEKIRRRMAMFERPLHSSSNNGRTWNGYGAYNPAMVGKMLDIFRVVHNYIDTRKEEDGTKTTPAMRLGLAQAPLDYKTVLYFEG